MYLEKSHIPNQNHRDHRAPESTLLAYEGPFFIDLLTMLGNHLKVMTSRNLTLQKKLFRVFVELSQNVSNYAEQYIKLENDSKNIGIGEVRIREDKNHYLLTTKNLVKMTDANTLCQRCEIINNADFENLKNLKRELRKSSTGYKLGARIGLVQARLISNNPLNHHILEENRDYSYFKLTVKFSKNGEH